MNVLCTADICPVILNSTCVFYEGNTLTYTGITTNDSLQTALQKIDAKFGDATIGYVFTNGLYQPMGGAPVGLGGSLTANTSIGGNFTLTFAGNLQAAKHITTGGNASQFVKGDGTLDSTAYQAAGNYITGLSGDVIASGPGIASAALAVVNTNPGTFGSATLVPRITVDSKGRVTSVTTTAINVPSGILSFVGDVYGSGSTGSPTTLTLSNVNSNVYTNNTFLKFKVNAKGLVTGAAPVTHVDLEAVFGYVPVPNTRTITINGTTQSLQSNITFTLPGGGTVQNVSVTPGVGISASVTNPSTVPNITITNTAPDQVVSITPGSGINVTGTYPNFTVAAINAGTVTAVTASGPLASSGGATPNITISQAGASTDGYLSSTDWNTFNGKQAAGNYITALTGEATASGPGSAVVTLSTPAVTSKLLTGVNIAGGSVVDTDSILTAFGKVQNQINGLIGGSMYKGTWDAATNTPTITSGVGATGWYYIVSVPGTTNIDGITDWNLGDWIIFDGTAWQQVDNTDAVVSVNGYTGAVSLVSSDVPEGLTNLYYTPARARTAISLTTIGTTGLATYDNITGVLNVPNYATDLSGYVPYTGATTNVNLGEHGLTAGYVGFDLTPTGTPTGVGAMFWDPANRTVALIDGDGDTTLQIGQEERILVHNNTGSTLTDGQLVYVTGSTGNLPSVALASAATESTSAATIGMITEQILNGADGFITVSGIVNGLNTLAFNEGDLLWLSDTPGGFTTTRPISPSHLVLIGYVIKKAGGNGSVLVKIQNTQELSESSDVLISAPQIDGQGLFLQTISGTQLWRNRSISDVLGYTPASAASVIIVPGTGTDSTLRCGVSNAASGAYSAALGGLYNTASGACSFIGGGCANIASNTSSFVGGGRSNNSSAQLAAIVNGVNNTASDQMTFVGNGSSNSATGYFAAIVSGFANTASGYGSFIGGGQSNRACTNFYGFTTVVGGKCNNAIGAYSSVLGGLNNTASAYYSTVSGGQSNTASGPNAFVGGGRSNIATCGYAFVGGGISNTVCRTGGGALSSCSSIVGGYGNTVSSGYSFIGGGGGPVTFGNTVSGALSSIVGGRSNTISSVYSFIGGGLSNGAHGGRSVIGGGYLNLTCGDSSVISGGQGNTMSTYNAMFSVIAGGNANTSSASYTAIVGGCANSITKGSSFIGGGNCNTVSGYFASVVGGRFNIITPSVCSIVADDAVIVGGLCNIAGGVRSFVGGGRENNAMHCCSIVVGGYKNTASGKFSFIGGGGNDSGICTGNTASGCNAGIVVGSGNVASGNYSFIGGGCNNVASGYYSLVLGGNANVANACYSTINGGAYNTNSGRYSSVSGYSNLIGADSICSVIGGGSSNRIIGFSDGGTIAGGIYNRITAGYRSFIGGGTTNCICPTDICNNNTISGGYGNKITGSASYAFIGGGRGNTASGYTSSIVGGKSNTACGFYSSIVGGDSNTSSAFASFLGGGKSNTASGNSSVVTGGRGNTASGTYSSVLGGYGNTATGAYSFIGSGNGNTASGCRSIVVGGGGDFGGSTASGIRAFIGGGAQNSATNNYSTVVNGENNIACGYNSFIGSGRNNTASGYYSTIIGGKSNAASACNSHIIGSCITASSINYTYVNNLCQTGGGVSDRRTKNTICDTGFGLCDIVKLRPVSYCWNHDPTNSKKYGFIAQEVQEAIPSIVSINEIEKVDKDGKRTILGDGDPVLQFEKEAVYASYVNAFKDLKAENDALKAEIEGIKEILKRNNLF